VRVSGSGVPTKSEYVVARARLSGIGSCNDFSQWLSILSKNFSNSAVPSRLIALHGARRPLVSIPGTSVTSATPVTCRASLALSSRRAFKGPRGALKSDPAKKNVAGSVVVRTSHNRRWCVLRRRDSTSRGRAFPFVPPRHAPTIDPARRTRLGGVVCRVPPRSRGDGEVGKSRIHLSSLAFFPAKATSGREPTPSGD
jgi:hypothetical protein